MGREKRCPVLFFDAVINTMADYSPSGKEVRVGTQAGAEPRTITEATGKLFLLASSPWLSRSAFLYYPGPKVASLPLGWALPPTSITNQEIAPTVLPIGNPMGTISQVKLSLPRQL